MTKAGKRMVEEIVERIENCPYHTMEGGEQIDISYVRMLEGAVADCLLLTSDWRARGSRIEELEKRIARMEGVLEDIRDWLERRNYSVAKIDAALNGEVK